MGETDKPFACPLSECGMKFTNEDHLTVHKKKHDMCLSFGNGQKMNIFADQTPTPTRFIRNCEEVGLFQDLQNVNPFEEQFRKAAEAVKSGTTTLHPEVEPMCGHADDTLHTPQVFPQIDHLSVSVSRDPESPAVPVAVITSSQSSITIETKTEKQSCFMTTSEKTVSEETATNKDANIQLLLRLPDGKVVKLSAVEMAESDGPATTPIHSSAILTTPSVIVDHPVTAAGQPTRTVLLHGNSRPNPQHLTVNASPKTMLSNVPDKMALAKQKLKQALTANQKATAAQKSEPALNLCNKVPIPALKEGKSLLTTSALSFQSTSRDTAVVPTSTGQKSKRPRESSGSSGDDTEKRQKFLERNRAAASRCRQKRKTWVNMLEHRANVMHSTNQQLMAEVSALKEEVAQLKTLLLAHRDCPVTKAMHQNDAVLLTENTQDMQKILESLEQSTRAYGVIRIMEHEEADSAETTESMPQTTQKDVDSPPMEVQAGVIRVVPANTSRATVTTVDISKKVRTEVQSVHFQNITVPLTNSTPIPVMCLPMKPGNETENPAPTYMIAPYKVHPEQVTQQKEMLVFKKAKVEKESVIVRNKI